MRVGDHLIERLGARVAAAPPADPATARSTPP